MLEDLIKFKVTFKMESYADLILEIDYNDATEAIWDDAAITSELQNLSVKDPSSEVIVTPMHSVIIEGIEIKFPFEPYEIQKEFMKNVINALNNKKNAMLESPTGTGKTYSLLWSTLAWMRYQKLKEREDSK